MNFALIFGNSNHGYFNQKNIRKQPVGSMDSHSPVKVNENKLSGLGVRSGWQLLSHRNASSGQQLT